MGHITRKTKWMDIDINTNSHVIFVQQRWKYKWVTENPVSYWSYQEKKVIHNKFDTVIWSIWSNKAVFDVTGTSDFAKQHRHTLFMMNLDIKWELSSNYHWLVQVTKTSKPYLKSWVSGKWDARKISLDILDADLVKKAGSPKGVLQYPVAHEFGHTVGNHPGVASHSDEYRAGNSFFSDKNSIMNVGNELRKRHFDYLVTELNTMIPNTTFSLQKV